MSDVDVVIIGAGMGGLTCGCLLAQKGLKVVMIEKNQKAGGCCTSFQKEGFSFDLSVQSLGECQEGGRVWRVLKQLNLSDQVRFISLEPAREYHFPDQRVSQSSRMETHIENLSSLFPAERKGIQEVYAALGKIFEEFSSLRSSLNWFEPSSFLSRYPYLSRYKDKTYGELLDECISHSFLKTLLSIRSSYALLPPEEISAVGMAGIEMSYFNHGVSCVDGKVEQLPMKMGEVLVEMGGEILTGHEAQQILMDEKRAIGVRLKNGQEMTGKIVVSNVDAHHTFSDLIGENHIPAGFRSKLKGMRPSLSYFILYLGIEGDVDELPVSNNEIFFGDSLQKEFDFLYENRISEKAPIYLLVPSKVNPSHAPAGKTTLCLSCKASYGFGPGWDRKTKNELSRWLIHKASAFIPNLERRILVKIETTPKTIEQWTGNRWGAAYGWAQIPRQSGIYRLPRTAPIPNLYLTGHWTSPGGGIAGVVASGELTAEAVLSRLEKGE
jgi:prolycopene isomerase